MNQEFYTFFSVIVLKRMSLKIDKGTIGQNTPPRKKSKTTFFLDEEIPATFLYQLSPSAVLQCIEVAETGL